MDIVTPWEEGGAVRVAFHPGKEKVTMPWPSVTVGHVGSPEDAVFVDVDGNGILDVVTSCEGSTRAVFVHWAPSSIDLLMDPSEWATERFPTIPDEMQYMFCTPFDFDNDGDLDLIVGGKNRDAAIGFIERPDNSRNLGDWKWHHLRSVGWIMSIMVEPKNESFLFSDRKGPLKGVYRWAVNKKPALEIEFLGAGDYEVMFLNTNHRNAIAWAAKEAGAFVHFEGEKHPIHFSLDDTSGGGKGVALGDIDGDGLDDVVMTCENSKEKFGVFAFLQPATDRANGGAWKRLDVGGKTGTKFDRIELVDLDQDGDLDVLTCEEREGLGVIWYENPLR